MYAIQTNIFGNHAAACWNCGQVFGPLITFTGTECPVCLADNRLSPGPAQEGEFRFWRENDGVNEGVAQSNLAQRYVMHSPTGFEWGYGGSGPADLALNMVQYVLENNQWQGERVRRGWFEEAEAFHQEVKRNWLVNIPREGGTIDYRQFERVVMELVKRYDA